MLAGTTFSDLLRLEPMTLRLGCQKSGVRQSVRGEKVTTWLLCVVLIVLAPEITQF